MGFQDSWWNISVKFGDPSCTVRKNRQQTNAAEKSIKVTIVVVDNHGWSWLCNCMDKQKDRIIRHNNDEKAANTIEQKWVLSGKTAINMCVVI